MNPRKTSTLAATLHGFFTDYLPRQRALSPHTLHSYRDSLKLLLAYSKNPLSDLFLLFPQVPLHSLVLTPSTGQISIFNSLPAFLILPL
jgi:site-specific recombinase XerC